MVNRAAELDTLFKSSLFDEENALLFKMTIMVPARGGTASQKVTYTYEGPDKHQDSPTRSKIIYRQVEGGVKKALITKQMNYLKI